MPYMGMGEVFDPGFRGPDAAMVSPWYHHLQHWQQQLAQSWPALDPLHAGVGTVIVLVLVHTMRSFLAARENNSQPNVTVKWGREKIHVPLPSPDAKLATLRAALADHTSLPADSFKLVHAGAVMKDDNAPISAYGIRANSKIALIGGGEALAPPSSSSKKANVPVTEENSIKAIQAELASINKNIVPALDSFLATISPQAPATTSSVPPAPTPTPQSTTASSYTPVEDVDLEHRRLGELLLQSLLRLDVINMDGAWTDARKERKVAVKTVQGLLDKLDGGWRARNERLKSSA